MENKLPLLRVRKKTDAPVKFVKSVRIEDARDEREEVKPKMMIRILDKIIAVSICMVFLGLPIFFTGRSLQGIVFEKQIYFYFWTLLALISWSGKGIMLGEMKIRRTPLDIPIVFFWAVYLLVSIISVDRWHSFFGVFGDPSRGFMNVTALVIMYYLIMSNFSLRLFRWIIAAILASSFAVIAWSLLKIFSINLLPAGISSFIPLSLVGSVSGLGMFLSIILPLIIMTIFKLQDSELGKIVKNILTAVLLVGVIADIVLLLVLFGFVPWIGLMVGFGIFLIFILSRIVRPNERWTWIPIVSFVLLMVIWMSGSSFNLVKIDLPLEVGSSYGMSYQIAKESLKNNFILGTGAASYGYDFSLYKPESFNLNQLYNLRFYQATGVVFEAISSVGILGTLALSILLLSFVSVCAYLLVIRKEKDKIYSLGLAAASFVFLISAVFSRTEGSLLIFGTLIALLALAMVIRESESEEKFFNISLKTSPKYALTLAFIFIVISAGVIYLFVFIGKIYAADIFAGKAAMQGEADRKQLIETMNKAINLNDKESKYHTIIGQSYMILANDEMLKSGTDRDMNAVQAYLNQSITASINGKNISPNDVSAIEALAQVYESAGIYASDSLKLAGDAYSRALKLEPNNPNFVLGLGKIKLNQAAAAKGEEEKKQLANEAKDLFQKSVDMKNNFAPGFYQLAIVQSALGDLDSAISTMSKAVSFDNSNISYFFNLARLYQQRAKGDDEKIAEAIFQKILGVNDKEINAHFSLAALYEKMGEKEKALSEYSKTLDLVPAENGEVRKKIEEMIVNVKNGTGNLKNTDAEIVSQAN